MQNQYTGDVGDFGKYSLLKALVGNDLRLGVVWYLIPDEEGDRHGGLVKYPKLRECAPDLYDSLAAIRSAGRSVAAIEERGILPPGTVFHSDPIGFADLSPNDKEARSARRLQWNREAFEKMARADLVFMDPDIGLAEGGARAASKKGAKYVFPEELVGYVHRRQSLVVYQHQLRLRGWVQRKLELVRQSTGVERPWALTFRPQSVRAYLIIPSAAHEEILVERSQVFIRSLWGRRGYFHLSGLSAQESAADEVAKTETPASRTPSSPEAARAQRVDREAIKADAVTTTADNLPECLCGCGERVLGRRRRFRQGHDARFHSYLRGLRHGQLEMKDLPLPVQKWLQDKGITAGEPKQHNLQSTPGTLHVLTIPCPHCRQTLTVELSSSLSVRRIGRQGTA